MTLVLHYEKEYIINGERRMLCLSQSSAQDIKAGWPPYAADVFRILPSGDWEIQDRYVGNWAMCLRWLGKKLTGSQREQLYQSTALHTVHQQQSEKNARNGAAAEQYVASYLALHLNLTVHVNNPGTPGKDLVAYQSGSQRACAIQVKYRESAKTVKVRSNASFNFLICVTPGTRQPVGQPLNTRDRYRHQLASFIVPSEHILPNENVGFYYANYEEHWGDILDFFRP